MQLTEGHVAKRLWRKYGVGQYACANIHYYAFESDLLILRKSGTVVEYEIKLSVQDFKAGLRKKQCLHGTDKRRRVNKLHKSQKEYTRHEYLTKGFGANMFYYAAPAEVLENVNIPEWAGIIQVQPNARWGCLSRLLEKAPFLHKNDPSPELKEKILTSCYYKYWQHFAVDNINFIRTK